MAGNQVGRRAEPDKELARALLAAAGEEVDYEYLARQHGTATVQATKDELARSQLPLKQFETKLDGTLSRTVKDRLRVIGCAMRPDFSPDQANAWVDAILIKLADLPPTVLAKAAERAPHIAFQFPSEVETKLRELAHEHMERIDKAMARCDHLMRTIHEAANPRPALPRDEPLNPGERVLDDDLVHRLQRDPTGMGQAILDLGKAKGWVTPDQLQPPEIATED